MVSVEQKRLYDIEYRKAHVMENREKQEKFVRSPKGIYKTLKANSAKRGMLVEIPREDFIAWYESEAKSCCYCGIPESEIAKVPTFRVTSRTRSEKPRACERLTIDRIDNRLSYKQGNLALSCYRCNRTKSDFFSHAEMLIVGKLIKTKWESWYQ